MVSLPGPLTGMRYIHKAIRQELAGLESRVEHLHPGDLAALTSRNASPSCQRSTQPSTDPFVTSRRCDSGTAFPSFFRRSDAANQAQA